MGKNKYVGHRYIPIFENGWDKTKTYEPLTFVYYEGKTYVSRQLVPTNIEITDNDFWAFFMDNAPQIFTPTFTGQWEDKPYEPLSIVIDNGNTYVSKQNVPIGTVLTDETYWLDLSTYYNQLFTDYETAEQGRVSAESIRVENENQRQIDHANRSAELAGKADKKQEDWITPTLLNGATGNIQFRKNQFGRVEFIGTATGSQGRSVFTLPTGYRPLNVFRTLAKSSATSNEARSVYITKTGVVYFEQPYGTYEVYFDTISFSAD